MPLGGTCSRHHGRKVVLSELDGDAVAILTPGMNA